MFTKITYRAARTSVALIALGWLSLFSPDVAQSQPTVPPIPIPINPGDPNPCPGDNTGGPSSDFQYIADPNAPSQAYYACADGMPQQHLQCPSAAAVNMTTTPPTCRRWRAF
jgi:hypothetical protein